MITVVQTWILIIGVLSGTSSAITVVEFNDKSACLVALKEAKQKMGSWIDGVCVDKGNGETLSLGE